MKNTLYLVPAIIVVVLCLLVIKFYPEPEPEKTSPFSEDCVFYRKVIDGEMVISEPSAGTYRYEVYATKDGIEVWKCNSF